MSTDNRYDAEQVETERSLADRLFAATMKQMLLEDEAHDAVMVALGIDPEKPDAWPHSDFTHDYYDCSYEFKGTKPGWTPTAEQIAATFALGFDRCWICYTDGTEVSFAAPRRPFPVAAPNSSVSL